MPELGGFAEIAPYLTHPLVLAGFGLLLFFGLLRAVLKSRVMPTVSQRAGGTALNALLRYGFIVALVIIVLGFALVFFREARADPPLQWGALGGALLVCAAAGWVVFREAKQPEGVSDRVVREAMAALRREYESKVRGLEQQRSADQETIASLNAAVRALARAAGQPDAPAGIPAALEKLARGDKAAAEAIFAEILERRAREGSAAIKEAAAAARHLGALAYLHDTRKAIAAYQRAADLDPDDVWTWLFLGLLHQRAGSLAAAEEAFGRALAAAERSGDERDRSVAQAYLGDVRRAQGSLPEALQAYEQARGTLEALAGDDPDNPLRQRDLSISHERIGGVLVAQGALAGALAAYRAGLTIAEALAGRDPGNAEWQRDLSVSHNKIGDVLRAQGDLAAALAAYREGLGIRQALAGRDPGNAGWQRDLSVSWERLASVREDLGDRAGAQEAWRTALAISERLAEAFPDGVEIRTTPVIHLAGVARTLDPADPAAPAEAARLYDRALALLRPLAEAGKLDANRQGWIAWIEEQHAALAQR